MAASRVDRCILEAARRAPDSLAVVCGDEHLSYRDFLARAFGVARALTAAGLGVGDRVLLAPVRDLDAFPAMMGIWWAGGVLVPLPASSPTAQVHAVIEDCSPRAIVGPADFTIASAQDDRPLIQVSPAHGSDDAEPDLRGSDDAYIIYTSGTTGRPKGVIGTHAALHQYIDWQATEFANEPAERFSQIAPLAFDFSLKEILVPLTRGASVWIVDEALRLDGRKLLQWLGRSGITSTCCMPLVFRELTAALASLPAQDRSRALGELRRIHISGDMLYWDDVERWRGVCPRDVELVNMYGPTETTIIKAFYRIPRDRPGDSGIAVPVGKPITAADFHLIRPDGSDCAAGETGEVAIASAWLARGYTAPALTEQRFRWFERKDGRSHRHYLSGDLGRLTAEGLLELAGRADRQVKINGVRIELEGVEAALRPCVEDLAVVAPLVAGERELTCFFVAADPRRAEQALRANAARDRMPAEVPRRFIALDALPRTVNGKLDRERLHQLATAQTEAAPPTLDAHEVLSQVTAVWRDVLKVDVVASDAGFFELGGDSMTAISLLRSLRNKFQVRLRLVDMLDDMTPAGICRRIEQQRR